MSAELWLASAGGLLLAALGTEGMRRYALARRLLDQPNARSSHRLPTPRGGGVAMVAVYLLALLWLACAGELPWSDWAGLSGGAAAVALVGFADDHRRLSARLRLAVHTAAALWTLAWLGRGAGVDLGPLRLQQAWLLLPLAALVLVWSINLFNFMDGIDGLAGSEGLFAAAGSALWLYGAGATPGWVLAAATLAASAAGFLVRNWPPAKIFMGDAGSGFLGCALAALLVGGVARFGASPWPWLILTAAFWSDATYTLLHRWRRGECLTEAHRSHAYQILARCWRSHLRTTLAYAAVNLLWLAPLAAAAARWRTWGAPLWAAAVLPLWLVAWRSGAGGAHD